MTLREESSKLGAGYLRLLYNTLVVYICQMITRVVFVWANYDVYSGKVFGADFWNLLHGSLVFDTSTICYSNLLIALLTLFPLHLKESSPAYARVLKWVYVVVNSIFCLANLPDVIYFRFTNRRTTASFFTEFGNDSNVGGIVASEALKNWWLVVIGIAIIVILAKCYRCPLSFRPQKRVGSYVLYYVGNTALLALTIVFGVFGIRGGMTRDTRPITLSNANQYVSQPIQAPMVLNTPFSVIRTMSHKPFRDPQYFTLDEAAQYFTPVHQPDTASLHFGEGRGKNVVVLIVESFAREYIGGYNKSFIGPDYEGFTPFTDSLLTQSMWAEQSFTNSRKSIDGMPSVLSSLPYFEEPFFLTVGALNHLDGLAVELAKDGYHTSFFHGAPNGSMGFEAFAKATGFGKYYGMTEYCEDPEFGGEADFDGHWAIWDEEFLQYYAKMLGTFEQPFVSSLFTASNHHPFRIPERYKEIFPEGDLLINKCTRYTDYALRRFFETASKHDWYQNTLFVICSDHVNMTNHASYETDLGSYTGPVIFFCPGESPFRGQREGVVQQIDVMPTVLNYLGHTEPYVAFGNDLLNTPADSTWAVSYRNGFYQLVKYGYVLQFDGQKTTAVYALDDKLMEHNLVGTVDVEHQMETELKAIIEQYMKRMESDMLLAE